MQYFDCLTSLSIEQYTSFISLLVHLQEKILWSHSAHATMPLVFLPRAVTQFLATTLRLEEQLVLQLWSCQKELLWPLLMKPQSVQNPQYLPLFLEHGISLNIGEWLNDDLASVNNGSPLGFSDLYPPTRVCIDPRCATESSISYRSRELTDVISYNVTIFMKDLGPVPGWAFLACCPCEWMDCITYWYLTPPQLGCGARYYPNYIVEGRHHQSRCMYYTEVPAFIQVSMHYYIDTRLAEMFTNMMVCAWCVPFLFVELQDA